eukprot:tig00020538_g10354.t1
MSELPALRARARAAVHCLKAGAPFPFADLRPAPGPVRDFKLPIRESGGASRRHGATVASIVVSPTAKESESEAEAPAAAPAAQAGSVGGGQGQGPAAASGRLRRVVGVRKSKTWVAGAGLLASPAPAPAPAPALQLAPSREVSEGEGPAESRRGSLWGLPASSRGPGGDSGRRPSSLRFGGVPGGTAPAQRTPDQGSDRERRASSVSAWGQPPALDVAIGTSGHRRSSAIVAPSSGPGSTPAAGGAPSGGAPSGGAAPHPASLLGLLRPTAHSAAAQSTLSLQLQDTTALMEASFCAPVASTSQACRSGLAPSIAFEASRRSSRTLPLPAAAGPSSPSCRFLGSRQQLWAAPARTFVPSGGLVVRACGGACSGGCGCGGADASRVVTFDGERLSPPPSPSAAARRGCGGSGGCAAARAGGGCAAARAAGACSGSGSGSGSGAGSVLPGPRPVASVEPHPELGAASGADDFWALVCGAVASPFGALF